MGCGSAPSTAPSDYVGEYVFKPNNAGTGNFADFVILRSDHIAIEVRFSKGADRAANTQESWYLTHTTGENVVIGNYSYPVEVSRSAIKPGINELGQYYEKVR